MIDQLIKGLNVSYLQVYDLNYNDALNWLSYYKHLDEIKEEQHKKMNKNKV